MGTEIIEELRHWYGRQRSVYMSVALASFSQGIDCGTVCKKTSLTLSLYHIYMCSQQGVNNADAKSGMVNLVVVLKLIKHHCFDLRRACCEDRSHVFQFRDSLLSKWVKWAFPCSFCVFLRFNQFWHTTVQFYIASVHQHVPRAAMLMASDLLISSLMICHAWHDGTLRDSPPERRSSRGCGPCVLSARQQLGLAGWCRETQVSQKQKTPETKLEEENVVIRQYLGCVSPCF